MMFFGKKSVDVRVVRATLVARFQNANPPLLWKFDLERNHSFTLAFQGEEGDWELGVTSLKGEFYPVVHFTTREDAEEAFTATGQALARGKRSWPMRLLKIFGLLVIAFLLVLAFLVWASPRMTSWFGFASRNVVVAPQVPQQGPAQIPPGIPVPADQVLKPPL